jgi:hypothetical protein
VSLPQTMLPGFLGALSAQKIKALHQALRAALDWPDYEKQADWRSAPADRSGIAEFLAVQTGHPSGVRANRLCRALGVCIRDHKIIKKLRL